MDFVEVDGEASCTEVCDFSLGINGDQWVITAGSHEGRDAGSCMGRVIVGEFR